MMASSDEKVEENQIGIISGRENIEQHLISMGYESNHIRRALKMYEKNYDTENGYDTLVIVQVIQRLMKREKKKKNKAQPKTMSEEEKQKHSETKRKYIKKALETYEQNYGTDWNVEVISSIIKRLQTADGYVPPQRDTIVKYDELDGKEIDDILDEIEKTEEKLRENKVKNTDIDYSSIKWDEIMDCIREGKIQFIKNLISSNEIDINIQHPDTGKTLLIYAIIIGNFDLVKAVCNFGCDVSINDNDNKNALDYAMIYGRYKITELLYYRQLSGSLGNDLKDIATTIHEKTEQAEIIVNNAYEFGNWMCTSFMPKMIEQRLPFSQDILFYAWHFCKFNDVDPFNTELWRAMMNTFEQILTNTSDKYGWDWMKKYLIPSLIWYLPHPKWENNNDEKNELEMKNDNEEQKMEFILQKTLFYELLVRVRKESKRQSDLLLKKRIQKVKAKAPNDWKQLISFNIHTKHSANARQDSLGCLVAKYTEADLSDYPPTITFSAKKFYDTQIYLHELIFRANILDKTFQDDMKLITKTIKSENTDIEVSYIAGPVKTATRSQVKVENDYIDEDWPKSSRILDLNRCACQFANIRSLMKFIECFTRKVENKEAGCVTDIIRCKNGWSVYSDDCPSYTDIKFNVLVKTLNNGDIIAEIQFLLDLMSDFKKKAHKLYGVERKFEMVYNFGALKQEMNSFGDFKGTNDVIIHLVATDDIDNFLLLWKTIKQTPDHLYNFENKQISNAAIFNIMDKDGKIDKYLRNQDPDLYYEALYRFFETYTATLHKTNSDKGYTNYFSSIFYGLTDVRCANFIQHIFYAARNDGDKLMKLFQIKDQDGQTLLDGIVQQGSNIKSIKMILNTRIIDKSDKISLILCTRIVDQDWHKSKDYMLDCALEILQFVKYDRDVLLKLITDWLTYFCSNKSKASTQILKLILNSTIITEKEKIEMFSRQEKDAYDEEKTNAETACDGRFDNLSLLLDYFGGNVNKSIIKKWFTKYTFKKQTFPNPNIVSICRYFKDDRKYLLKILSTKWDPQSNSFPKMRLFDFILRSKSPERFVNESKNGLQILKCLLNESSLTYKDVLKLLFNNKDFDNPMVFTKNPEFRLTYCGYEILKYIQNDRVLLMNYLAHQNSQNQTILLLICGNDGSEINNQKALKLLLQNIDTLCDVDKFKLLQIADNMNRSALGCAFQSTKDNGMLANIILESFKDSPDLLLKLLMQKVTSINNSDTIINAKPCITYCCFVANIKTVIRVINNDNKLCKLFKYEIEHFDSDIKNIIIKYRQYATLNGLLIDNISNLNETQINNLFILSAYEFEKVETIEKLLTEYFFNKQENLLNVLSLPDDNGYYLLMKSANKCRLEILNIFKDNEKSLLILLQQTNINDWNKKTLDYICATSDIESVKLIFNSSINEQQKIELLTNVIRLGEITFHSVMKGNIDIALQIIKYYQKDKNTLIKLLNDEDNSQEIPFMYIKSHSMLKLLLNSSLTHENIIRLLTGVNSRGENFLYRILCCDDYIGSIIILQILEYLKRKNDTQTLKTILTQFGWFKQAIRSNILTMKSLLICINELDYKTQEKILLEANETVFNTTETEHVIFSYADIQYLTIIFSTVNNNQIMSQFMCLKNIYGKTLLEKIKLEICDKYDDAKYEIQILIEEYLEYLKFDQWLDKIDRNNNDEIDSKDNMKEINLLFQQYETNPFITSCQLGKVNTILKLLNYVKGIDNNGNKVLVELFLSAENSRAKFREIQSKLDVKVTQLLEKFKIL